MGKFNRRNFLKSSLIGAGGALIAKPAISSTTPREGNEKVITRTLGKTGLQLPVLSMGVMRSDNPRLVTAAMDSGIIFFDTAYGYQKGKNEEMLGEVFKDYQRDNIIIQTKIPPGLATAENYTTSQTAIGPVIPGRYAVIGSSGYKYRRDNTEPFRYISHL